MKLKKKYEKIECSKEHLFRIDFDGVIKVWKLVVEDTECIAYEDDVETARMPITNRECAPGVLQLNTSVMVFGEKLRFQLENNVPFIKLDGEWTPSDTFQTAKRNAAVKMYKRHSLQEAIAGTASLLVVLTIKLIFGDIGDWWMLSVFGVFFYASAAMRMARLHVELQAIKEAEAEEAAGTAEAESVARVKPALEAAKEE